MKTRIITRVAAIAAVLVSFALFTACQSKEERALSQLESLCETIEQENFSLDDMDAIQAKYDAIHATLEECNLTNEQVKERSKLEARYTKAVAKKAVQRIGGAIDGFLEGLGGNKE